MSDYVQPHRRQPTRLPCPWDSPGKNTGVGCHFLLQFMKVKSESELAQSCLTVSDPMDCSLPGSSIHGFSRQEYWSGVPVPSPRIYTTMCKTIITTVSTSSKVTFMSAMTHLKLERRADYQQVRNFTQAHFLLCVCAKSLQLCPTMCDPIDGSPPGSPVPGILQARTLEWVAISFSNA